jgi:hypothetical protein
MTEGLWAERLKVTVMEFAARHDRRPRPTPRKDKELHISLKEGRLNRLS